MVLPTVEPALSAIVYGRPDVQVTDRPPVALTEVVRPARLPKSMSAATIVQLEVTATCATNVLLVNSVALPLPTPQPEPPLGNFPVNWSVEV